MNSKVFMKRISFVYINGQVCLLFMFIYVFLFFSCFCVIGYINCEDFSNLLYFSYFFISYQQFFIIYHTLSTFDVFIFNKPCLVNGRENIPTSPNIILLNIMFCQRFKLHPIERVYDYR